MVQVSIVKLMICYTYKATDQAQAHVGMGELNLSIYFDKDCHWSNFTGNIHVRVHLLNLCLENMYLKTYLQNMPNTVIRYKYKDRVWNFYQIQIRHICICKYKYEFDPSPEHGNGCIGQETCTVVPELISPTWVKPNPRYDSKCENIFHNLQNMFRFNSLRPSDTIWRHRSGSTLAQVMACCLRAPNHYLDQCWLLVNEALNEYPSYYSV